MVYPEMSKISIPDSSILFGSDLKINEDGKVTGELLFKNSYPEYSENEDEQHGQYFPFSINVDGSTMTFKKNGDIIKDNVPFKKDNVLRLDEYSDYASIERTISSPYTLEILVDNESIATLDLSGLNLAPHNHIVGDREYVPLKNEEGCYKYIYNCKICGEYVTEDPPVQHVWDEEDGIKQCIRCRYTVYTNQASEINNIELMQKTSTNKQKK